MVPETGAADPRGESNCSVTFRDWTIGQIEFINLTTDETGITNFPRHRQRAGLTSPV